jgi:hypothetical protein
MEGKKSFVLYCDLIEVIEDLTDTQRGKLLTTILEYVNDLNPNIDSIEDKLVKVSFKHIRQDLKRDLQKWKNISERNSLNGKKGGRPSKNPENPPLILGNPNKPRKAVNDTVNVNDTLKEKHLEVFRKVYQDKGWIESVCMKFKCEMEDLKNHLIEFKDSTLIKEEFKEDTSDTKKHFINWVNKGNPIKGSNQNKIILEPSKTYSRNPE